MAYVHPALMLLGLGLAFLALRIGLDMRRRRVRGATRSVDVIVRHVWLGRRAVPLLLFGFVLGPFSAFFLRDWRPFDSFHALLGVVCALLFATTGWIGLQLQARRSAGVDLHAWLGLLAALMAAVASIAGFVLLP